MRKISVILDDASHKALDEVMCINSNCRVSDAVCAALIAFSKDKQPSMIIEPDVLKPVREALGDVDLVDWCEYHEIDRYRLTYLLKSVKRGCSVSGTGNYKNKWRDKRDDRKFKTHTAWIAHCLKEIGIDLK